MSFPFGDLEKNRFAPSRELGSEERQEPAPFQDSSKGGRGLELHGFGIRDSAGKQGEEGTGPLPFAFQDGGNKNGTEEDGKTFEIRGSGHVNNSKGIFFHDSSNEKGEEGINLFASRENGNNKGHEEGIRFGFGDRSSKTDEGGIGLFNPRGSGKSEDGSGMGRFASRDSGNGGGTGLFSSQDSGSSRDERGAGLFAPLSINSSKVEEGMGLLITTDSGKSNEEGGTGLFASRTSVKSKDEESLRLFAPPASRLVTQESSFNKGKAPVILQGGNKGPKEPNPFVSQGGKNNAEPTVPLQGDNIRAKETSSFVPQGSGTNTIKAAAPLKGSFKGSGELNIFNTEASSKNTAKPMASLQGNYKEQEETNLITPQAGSKTNATATASMQGGYKGHDEMRRFSSQSRGKNISKTAASGQRRYSGSGEATRFAPLGQSTNRIVAADSLQQAKKGTESISFVTPEHRGKSKTKLPTSSQASEKGKFKEVRNPYVKSSSIQSNFQNMSAETDRLRKATEQAEAQRQGLLKRLQSGKQQASTLAESIRVAQDDLGGKQRELAILQREEMNLHEKISKERQILENLIASIGSLQDTDKAERRDFCTQMFTLNRELEGLLYEQEKERLVRLIHHECTVETFLGVDHQEDTEQDANYRASLQAALESLKKSGILYDQVLHQKEALLNKVDECRRRVLEDQVSSEGDTELNPWTYDRLIKLEDKWEHEWNSKDSSKKQVSFYSEGDENQGGDDVHEDVNDEPMET